MQLMYALGRDSELTDTQALQQFEKYLKLNERQYLLALAALLAVLKYSIQDYNRRRAKVLPTEFDQRFNYRLWLNDATQALDRNKDLQRALRNSSVADQVEDELVQLLYQEVLKLTEYRDYAVEPQPWSTEHDVRMLQTVFKTVMATPALNELFEEESPFWIEDKSLIVGAVKKVLRELPHIAVIPTTLQGEDLMTADFGRQLMRTALDKKQHLDALIAPKLVNWDTDRLAAIDLVLIRLCLTELLYFPTIPTKVSINEYVEMSKTYSTEKSKEFVNGVLDQLMKQLTASGDIVKEGRGLIE